MSKPLTDRVLLLTGAARGIGAATAVALAEAGAHVVALGRSLESLTRTEAAVRAAGGLMMPYGCDITDLAGLRTLADKINDRFGRLDGLVSNAAILGPRITLDRVDVEGWSRTLHVNVTGNLNLIQAFDALLKRSKDARVVFITAGIGSTPKVGGSSYSVSKAALDNLARTYAAEVAETPIRVNLFNPGPTRTSMRAAAAPEEDPMTIDTPEQVAEKIVSLCLPTFRENGKFYNYPTKSVMIFRAPETSI